MDVAELGSIAEMCLGVIYKLFIDITIEVYSIDRESATDLVMTSLFFMNRSVSTGPFSWSSDPETHPSYESSTNITDSKVRSLVTNLLGKLPNAQYVLLFGQDAWDSCQPWVKKQLIQTKVLPHPTLWIKNWLTKILRKTLLDTCCTIVGQLLGRDVILIPEERMDRWFRCKKDTVSDAFEAVDNCCASTTQQTMVDNITRASRENLKSARDAGLNKFQRFEFYTALEMEASPAHEESLLNHNKRLSFKQHELLLTGLIMSKIENMTRT